jgi:hypothetical protein
MEQVMWRICMVVNLNEIIYLYCLGHIYLLYAYLQ